MSNTEEVFDLFADEHEPLVREVWTTYNVTIPAEFRRKFGLGNYPWVNLNVYSDGLVSINDNSTWFQEPGSKNTTAMRAEMWEWLLEWELVQVCMTGPEDWEYFVTDKFLERSQVR